MAESLKERRERRRKRRVEPSKAITPDGRNRAVSQKDAPESVDQGGNFVVRWYQSTRNYVVGVRNEINKVTWPTREEASRLTRIVSIVLLSAAVALGGFAALFTFIFQVGIETPWIFLAVFVGFLLLLFGYDRYMQRSNAAPQIAAARSTRAARAPRSARRQQTR
ncbi:MAG: preprotein translocase subunit SecE [Phototrophicaceae bacterium]